MVVYAALGEWHQAWTGWSGPMHRRPVRLRRMLTEPPFDRRGLAVDPRYARLLRAAARAAPIAVVVEPPVETVKFEWPEPLRSTPRT